jgi:glutamate dehydrogenase/leucine dehydrogenase
LFNLWQATGENAVRAPAEAKLKVAINGFGRIGRNFLRCWHERENSPLEVVVVNDSGGVRNVSTSTHPSEKLVLNVIKHRLIND